MDYLARESAPFKSSFWDNIDKAVVEAASRTLVGRRFLNIYGPLGAGATSVQCDTSGKEEIFEDGIVKTSGRKIVPLPQLYQDFTLLWRDIENNEKNNVPLDVSAASSAAQRLAKIEDNLIFYGNAHVGVEGIFNVKGTQKVKLSDWSAGENPYKDISKALNMILEKGIVGKTFLCVNKDLYFDLQRIQAGTGITEAQRLSNMIDGLFNVSIIKEKKAALICAEPHYVDLAIGVDMATAYLELKDLNHNFRITETLLPRIKEPSAIVVLE